MPIGIKGQYIFMFSLPGKEDFLDIDELEEFTLIEEAGNVLPTFELSFFTGDEDLLKLMNEGNDLTVSMGLDRFEIETKLVLLKIEVTNISQSVRRIYINGVYSALKYLKVPVKKISDKKSGIEVIVDTVKSYFKQDIVPLSSSDSQYWIQGNVSDKKFVDNLWLHSDITNSYPLVGVSSDGTFVLRDAKALIGSDYKWRFSPVIEDESRDIIHQGDAVFISNTGFVNSLFGYGKEKLIYDLEIGTESTELQDMTTLLSKTGAVRRAEVEKRADSPGMINSNVHANYWQSYLKNVTSLAILGSTRLFLSYANMWRDTRVLDLVMYRDLDLSNNAQSSEYQTGLYIVSKVSRTLSKSMLTASLILSREAMFESRGQIR